MSINTFLHRNRHLEVLQSRIDVNNYIMQSLNTLRPRQYSRHFPDDIFNFIFLNENVWILLQISLKFVPKVRINNIPALVQIMAWRRSSDRPLSHLMLVNLLTRHSVSMSLKCGEIFRKILLYFLMSCSGQNSYSEFHRKHKTLQC